MSANLQFVKGIGPAGAKLLAKLKITTITELLGHYPVRYLDYSKTIPVAKAQIGLVALEGQFTSVRSGWSRGRKHITTAVFTDASGSLKVNWFSQPYRKESIPLNTKVVLTGVLDVHGNSLSIVHPDYTLVSEFGKKESLIVPVYKLTMGLTNKKLHNWIKQALKQFPELDSIVIGELSKELGLEEPKNVLTRLHIPTSQKDCSYARGYLAYEELFVIMAASSLSKKQHQAFKANSITGDIAFVKKILKTLKFELTAAQKKTLWDVLQDMEKTHPMNRLLNGDVGSGKTIVAAVASLLAVHGGYQVAVMAPSTILATQLAESFYELADKFDYGVGLLIGTTKLSERKQLQERLDDNSVNIIVGTQTLFQESIKFSNLGLVIVDEQHRFGVKQRDALQKKGQGLPHMLSMSATPIPRTLSLTLYGELDISVISQLPPGRKPVITKICKEQDRKDVYQEISQRLEKGQQAYVVCPLIDESDTLGAKSVAAAFQQLKKSILAKYKIAVLHGKLKPAEKEHIMQLFNEGKIDILTSTTVIEVGVNVPNATSIIIEGIERFGLAQAHQLRGRVRRSVEQGYCYLFNSVGKKTSQRVKALESSDSGFVLAEKDLEMRGPGAMYGVVQSGQLDLRIANLSDRELLAKVQKSAKLFIETHYEHLNKYPVLLSKINEVRSITKLK